MLELNLHHHMNDTALVHAAFQQLTLIGDNSVINGECVRQITELTIAIRTKLGAFCSPENRPVATDSSGFY
jgi:hypothetical protein